MRQLTRVVLAGVYLLAPMAIDAQDDSLRVTTPSDLEIVMRRSLGAPPQLVFEALTQPELIRQWLGAGPMPLIGCEVDLRPGGRYRYRFQRPDGKAIEVRGTYRVVEAPRRITFEEGYDFSPLELMVTTTLEGAPGGTAFMQRIAYRTKRERDQDLPGVTESAKAAYVQLARVLAAKRGG